MIREPETKNDTLLSAWSAGIALFCLVIGLRGAGVPLLQVRDAEALPKRVEDVVMLEDFEPPTAAPDALTEPEQQPLEDLEIPPLPELTPPLTLPEMKEITPLEEVRETPKPIAKKPEQPKSTPNPKAVARSTSKPPASTGTNASGSGSSPVAFNRAGSAGRFPDPTYPASARVAKQQGTVRLLVTVEANGVPSAIHVTTSSGNAALDSAARDVVSRRWRWPAGGERKFTIPIRFVLQ